MKAGKYAYDLNRAVSNPMGEGLAKDAEAGIAGKAEAGIAGKAEVGIAKKGEAITGKTGITQTTKQYGMFDRAMGRGRTRFGTFNPVDSIDARDSIGHASVAYPADLAKELKISSKTLSRDDQLDMETLYYRQTHTFKNDEEAEMYAQDFRENMDTPNMVRSGISKGNLDNLGNTYIKTNEGGYVRVGQRSVTKFDAEGSRIKAFDAEGNRIRVAKPGIYSVGSGGLAGRKVDEGEQFLDQEYNELFADEIAAGTMFPV
jgi:hypothetical protein